MRKCTVLTLVTLAMTGCVSAPDVLTSTPKSIVLEYNRNNTPKGDVIAQANAHCANYGKVASLTDTTISPSGNWYTRTFTCE